MKHDILVLMNCLPRKTKGSDGGDAKAYGIRVNGGEVTAKLTGNIVVDKINAGSGANIYGKVDAGKGPDGGNGGNVIAYGVYANGASPIWSWRISLSIHPVEVVVIMSVQVKAAVVLVLRLRS